MGQAKTNKLYRTFVKGLITEASYLTYPEDSSLDELNTVPSRKGNRIRRLGFNYNAANATSRPYDARKAMTQYMWQAVNNNAALAFLCVQNGNKISFYDRSVAGFSDSLLSFELDLNLYTRPGVSDSAYTLCKFASGKGFLFVVGKDIEPLTVCYDPTSNNFTVTKIIIQVRDFEGVADGLANDAEPLILSKEHYYNLINQGWVSPRSTVVTGA